MIDTQLLITGVIFGLSFGSIFFLMAIGLSLCFGLMRIISLDQLLYYSVGAYIAYSVSLTVGNLWLGLLAGMAVGGAVRPRGRAPGVQTHLRARYHFQHDYLVRHFDRRGWHHQTFLGSGPAAGAGADRCRRSILLARNFRSTGLWSLRSPYSFISASGCS